jgi:LPXTG-motif cell wall-anchored protein
MKILGVVVTFLGMAGFAQATIVIVPEIDATSAAAGIALVSGALLIIRGRRKR